MKRIIVATKNKGKINEIKEILGYHSFEVVSIEEAGIFCDIEEDGTTFEENALIKARQIFHKTHTIVIADDSGLEVDYLNGAPGIYSARFAGANASDSDRINHLLLHLQGVPLDKRSARFVCAIAAVLSEKDFFCVKGTCEGYINESPIGNNGFGYDPVFFIQEYGLTLAQMESSQKHKLSHRGKALIQMANILKERLLKRQDDVPF